MDSRAISDNAATGSAATNERDVAILSRTLDFFKPHFGGAMSEVLVSPQIGRCTGSDVHIYPGVVRIMFDTDTCVVAKVHFLFGSVGTVPCDTDEAVMAYLGTSATLKYMPAFVAYTGRVRWKCTLPSLRIAAQHNPLLKPMYSYLYDQFMATEGPTSRVAMQLYLATRTRGVTPDTLTAELRAIIAKGRLRGGAVPRLQLSRKTCIDIMDRYRHLTDTTYIMTWLFMNPAVSEYGATLEDWFARRTDNFLSGGRARSLVIRVLAGMAYMHRVGGLVHGDMYPGNIFMATAETPSVFYIHVDGRLLVVETFGYSVRLGDFNASSPVRVPDTSVVYNDDQMSKLSHTTTETVRGRRRRVSRMTLDSYVHDTATMMLYLFEEPTLAACNPLREVLQPHMPRLLVEMIHQCNATEHTEFSAMDVLTFTAPVAMKRLNTTAEDDRICTMLKECLVFHRFRLEPYLGDDIGVWTKDIIAALVRMSIARATARARVARYFSLLHTGIQQLYAGCQDAHDILASIEANEIDDPAEMAALAEAGLVYRVDVQGQPSFADFAAKYNRGDSGVARLLAE